MIWPVRRIRAFAAFLPLLVAGCTSSGAADPTSGPPSPPLTTAVSTPRSSSSSFSGPPKPVTPTVPADVPRAGPNTKPGEKPPVMPLEATQHTSDGAKAFAEFFIRTIDWGYATTSSAYMRQYFVASCIACASTADAIDSAAAKGHRFIGDRFTIRETTLTRSVPIGVSVTFDVTSAEVVDRHDNFVDGLPALHDFEEAMSPAWSGGRWVVAEMVPHS